MEGWISLHRKFIEWEWFDDPIMIKIFIYLLLSANHDQGKWHGTEIKRGQLITGLNSLSQKLKLSIKVIRNRLDKLEKTGEIGRQTGNQNTLITICKYDEYQSKLQLEGKQTGKRRANEGQTKGKRRATNNNDNNENNDNNINTIDFLVFWNLYNKKIDRPKSEKFWNKLDFETQKKIIDYIPKYLNSISDKKYQRHPMTFFNNRTWENEIIGINNIIKTETKHPAREILQPLR